MNYEGSGIYRHYKGGLYKVLGLGLKEDTVTKKNPDGSFDQIGEGHHEVICVVYQPLSTPSFLDERKEDFWLRELDEGTDPFNTPGRFKKERCAQCGSDDDLTPVGGGMIVCGVCGNNTR